MFCNIIHTVIADVCYYKIHIRVNSLESSSYLNATLRYLGPWDPWTLGPLDLGTLGYSDSWTSSTT